MVRRIVRGLRPRAALPFAGSGPGGVCRPPRPVRQNLLLASGAATNTGPDDKQMQMG